MAVPKKRTSKAKSGKSRWKHKAFFISQKSLSLAKSILSGRVKSFVYFNDELIGNNNTMDDI
uniref:Large ribosomal subunit protein bL32c n=1 Tax=Ptilothamnion sphaericum TaxID=1498216 RepID=A0A4D6WY52_9FLOR|nr:ribosomal protein L32 [Ptilothamnion sphaericum]QCI08352.1 ribosomal protein L32 [Ptilothamnion sphaericum]